jgi:hypothetical protein
VRSWKKAGGRRQEVEVEVEVRRQDVERRENGVELYAMLHYGA